MKSVVFVLTILASSVAFGADIHSIFSDGSKSEGFHETFLAKQTPKFCFIGDSNKICPDLKASVAQFNKALQQEGAESRIHVKACAQSIGVAMMIYSLRPVDDEQTVRKTVYVKECK